MTCSNNDFGLKELVDALEKDARQALDSVNPDRRIAARLCLNTVADCKVNHP